MPGFDERLKQHLERLAPPADPSGAFDRILEKKIRRRLMRRFEAGALAVVVVAATVGGTFALVRLFRSNGETERLGGTNPTPVPVRNGRIAYASNEGGSFDIWTANPDGTDATNLMADSFSSTQESSPAWSPDGKSIAFVSDREGLSDIWTIDASGGELVRLTQDPAKEEESLAWSPDGTEIAFIRNGDVFVMRVDGSATRRLTSEPGEERHPTWAPDGSKIAFSSVVPNLGGQPPGNDFSGIYVMNPDGSDVTALTEGPPPSVGKTAGWTADDWPDWSPDGTKIAFERSGHIYAIGDDGSDLTKLTDNDAGTSVSEQPAWSPDGRKIVFVRNFPGEETQAIHTMNADGSDLRWTDLTGGPGFELAPDWQPIPLSASPTAPATLTPSPTPSRLPAECDASEVTGDFDGNDSPDVALVAKTECLMEPADRTDPYTTEYALDVQWHAGQEVHPAEGIAPLPDCETVCQALAATDLNLDGTDEFILKVGEGASTYFIQVYELPASEAFGDPARTAPPGDPPGFPPGETARFAVGGSVTHYAALGCWQGNNKIIAEIAELNPQQTEYSVHETVLRFDPIDRPPFGQFTVVSRRDYKERFDTEVGPGDRFEPGGPCWMEQPSP